MANMGSQMWRLTTDNFRTNFPELVGDFAAGDNSTIERVIYQACQFHRYSPQATHYCAAHLLSLFNRAESVASTDSIEDIVGGGAGEVKKDQIGPMMNEYMTQAEKGRETFFTSTSYGRHFLALEKRTGQYVLGGILIE